MLYFLAESHNEAKQGKMKDNYGLGWIYLFAFPLRSEVQGMDAIKDSQRY